MGFLLSLENVFGKSNGANAVKPPFDIAGDLDTPVSAFAKLGAFDPRFLLESVEGGERLARYSFIGFGKCLEVRLDAAGLKVGDTLQARPNDQAGLLGALRHAPAYPAGGRGAGRAEGGVPGRGRRDATRGFFEAWAARGRRAHESRCPRWPGYRWPEAWSDIPPTTWCATSNGCPRRQGPMRPY